MPARIRCKFIVFIAVLAVACTPVRATRGNYVDDAMLRGLQTGVSTKAEVEQKLGTPTTTDPFDPNIWFYIGENNKTKAFFDHEIVSRRVIALTFNADGFLASSRIVSEKNASDIEIVKKTTPAPGKEMNAFEQFLSNLGKFNANQMGGNPAANGPPGR